MRESKAKKISFFLGRVFLSIIIFSTTSYGQAQNLKIHVNKKGKVGFVNQDGTEVIKCQYESAYPFENGYAIVSKSKKYGIIDQSGEIVLPLKYTQISSWNDDLYLIKSGKVMGLAKHSGEIVLEAKYSMISKSNIFGKALIALGGKSATNEKKTYQQNAKYGIIDAKGNVLIEPKYKGLYEFAYNPNGELPYYEGRRLLYSYHYTTDTLQTDCSFLGFSNNGFNVYECGVMDGKGKELLKPGLYYWVMKPCSDMVRYYIAKKKETICGYHNLNSNEAIVSAKFKQPMDEIKFWTHGDFIGDIAPVNGDSWTFIDKSGNVLRSGYQSLKHSGNTGLWAAQKTSGQWDVFDENNTNIDALSGFENINFPTKEDDKEVFTVEKESLYGCINRNGEVLVPFEYEVALSNTYDVIPVRKDGKWGMVSPSNKTIIPTDFTSILIPSERNASDFWVMKSDSLYYHYDTKKDTLNPVGYKAVDNFAGGIAHVKPVNMPLHNTAINRAQTSLPNTSQMTSDVTNLDEFKDSFGYLLKNDGTWLLDMPVSTLYKDAVIERLKTYGKKTLNDADKRKLLLDVTKENRSYDLKSMLSEEEWNY